MFYLSKYYFEIAVVVKVVYVGNADLIKFLLILMMIMLLLLLMTIMMMLRFIC